MKKTRRTKTITGYFLLCAVCISLVFLSLTGCPQVPTVTEARSIALDFKNTLFNPSDASDPSLRGLGVDSARITLVTTDSAGKDVSTDVTITAADIDPAYPFSQVTADVEGVLKSITAEAGDFHARMSAEDGDQPFHGWSSFANVLKFKVDYVLDQEDPAQSQFRLLVCPRGGSSPVLRADSGAQPAGTGLTDRAAALTTKQIALHIDLAENPSDVTFDLFTAVADENLAEVYNPDVNFDAFYVPDPWTGNWSYEEITSTGKSVGGTVYTMTKYNGDSSWSVTDPMGDGLTSGLIDLTDSTDPKITDKYLLLAVVLHYKNLTAPVDLICIPID